MGAVMSDLSSERGDTGATRECWGSMRFSITPAPFGWYRLWSIEIPAGVSQPAEAEHGGPKGVLLPNYELAAVSNELIGPTDTVDRVFEVQYAPAPGGRQYAGRRRVRLGDVTATGRLRLDALTRYTQDVSDDDTTDAGLSTEPAWVVRRTVVEVMTSARLGEDITITTFCSGLGRCWAQRHLRVRGEAGAHYEVSTLWICLDPLTGRPRELTDQFLSVYQAAAGDRSVSARLTHPKPPGQFTRWRWPLRAVDFDVYGHVNNAAYWAVVEQVLATAEPPEPFRAAIEYRAGLDQMPEVNLASAGDGRSRWLWWLINSGTVAASAVIESCSPAVDVVDDTSNPALRQ
jgi:acyl-ACP thioesterase